MYFSRRIIFARHAYARDDGLFDCRGVMWIPSLRDPLRVVATLGRVVPSPAGFACHLSRFNGRAYSRKGGILRIEYYG